MGSIGPALLRLLSLLLALLGPGSTEEVNNALVGATVQLKVIYSGKATGYTWTKENTRVAEWDEPGRVTYYETLRGRCELDTSTGVLTIRDLKEGDSAGYKGEALVQNLYVSSNYHLRVFPSLNDPTVTCNVTGGNYTVLCDHRPEPPAYSWRGTDGLKEGTDYWLSNSNKNFTFANVKVPFQSLECVVQNPVSTRSAPVPKDCFKYLINNGEKNPHRRYGLITFAVIGSMVILAVCIGIFLWDRFEKHLPQCLRRHGVDSKDSAEGRPLVYAPPRSKDSRGADMPAAEEEQDRSTEGSAAVPNEPSTTAPATIDAGDSSSSDGEAAQAATPAADAATPALGDPAAVAGGESIENVNAPVGATHRLTLKYTGEAKGYTWTKDNDKIAEWLSPGEVCYHGALKDRCELSTSTGELTIRDLRVADSSRYKGEALFDSGPCATEIHLSVSDESACEGPGNEVPQSGSGEGGNADDPDQRSYPQVSDAKNEEIEEDGVKREETSEPKV